MSALKDYSREPNFAVKWQNLEDAAWGRQNTVLDRAILDNCDFISYHGAILIDSTGKEMDCAEARNINCGPPERAVCEINTDSPGLPELSRVKAAP